MKRTTKTVRCAYTLLIACCIVTVSDTTVDYTVLNPATLSYQGNTADSNSTVSWASIPAGTAYKAGSATVDDKGLGPLYDFARSFINTVQPASPDYMFGEYFIFHVEHADRNKMTI